MRLRAVHVVVPVMIVAVCGCGLIKKKRKKFDDTQPISQAPLEPPAFNRADLSRFPDEVLLHGEADLIRQITFARTAPDEGGTTVGVIDPDTAILKWSSRRGSTLVTFNRQAFPGKKFAGWVSDAAFKTATAAGAAKPTGTPRTTSPVTVGTPTPIGTPTPTGTSTLAIAGTTPPPSGRCQLVLTSTSFIPSSPGCSFNEKVRAGSPSTMTFPCAGGSAVARFSSQTFTGTADSSRVRISNTALFPFAGCNVRSVQTISGTPPNLSYSYSESIVSGTCEGTSTCTARGTVSAL